MNDRGGAESERHDVVIVGLGPVGAVLAALCAQLGLRVYAAEKDTDIYRLPRAVHVDYEVLRLLNLVGVAEAVLANSVPSTGYEFVNRERKVLMSRHPPPVLAPTGYPWANMFHQPSLEAALRERLDELANVRVALGATVTEVRQDGDGVTALVQTDGGVERIHGRCLVACDGGRSFVRQALGIDMIDLGFDEPWVVVDVKLAPGVRQLSEVSIQLCDPAQPTTFVLSGPGRHRWEFMLRPGEDYAAATAPDALKERIAAWVDPDTIELERAAVYEFHGLIARHWRRGHIALIGDAAHQMPPFMGQGLCSGVRDAFNLAWKLAAVLRGDAGFGFLDTVQREREPHVASITESAIALGKIVCVADEAQAAARDRKMLADHVAGRPPPFPAMPKIVNGVLNDRGAGVPMPEPMVAAEPGGRLDDVAGYVPLLVLANGGAADAGALQAFRASVPGACVAALDNAQEGQVRLKDEANMVRGMLGAAPALLAKPDRIVFGVGDAPRLVEQWSAYLAGSAIGS